MRFRADNEIAYMQDRVMYVGIPAGVDFVVTAAPRVCAGDFHLTADGYGTLADYGSGIITVWKADLSADTRKRLKEESDGK